MFPQQLKTRKYYMHYTLLMLSTCHIMLYITTCSIYSFYLRQFNINLSQDIRSYIHSIVHSFILLFIFNAEKNKSSFDIYIFFLYIPNLMTIWALDESKHSGFNQTHEKATRGLQRQEKKKKKITKVLRIEISLLFSWFSTSRKRFSRWMTRWTGKIFFRS